MTENTDLNRIIDFILETEKLKDTHRSGNTAQGKSESTAEHSWRLGLMVLFLADLFPECDSMKMMALSLVHDLGELDHGDHPAVSGVGNNQKYEEEAATIQRLSRILADEKGPWLADLWQEYDEGKTPEAKVVKALDKIETILQHNQGDNPQGFDHSFNLTYGSDLANENHVLKRIREIVDAMTEEKL